MPTPLTPPNKPRTMSDGHTSTGGSSLHQTLEGKTLPAFEILEKRAAG